MKTKMNALAKAVLPGAFTATPGAMEVAVAQTPDNPERKENTRQRENREEREK